MTRRVVLWLGALMALGAVPSVAQQLVPAMEPVLVECHGQPCFRLTVNAIDAGERPLPLDFQSLRVAEGSTRYEPFYISDVESAEAPRRRTYWMLLLDLSGSMARRLGNGTRFQAARTAIDGAIADLREGVDHFALVPFESHGVRQAIATATFDTSIADARKRLAAIRNPEPRNNTALYTAIYEALAVLHRLEQEGNDVSLVVFTDGRNEVYVGKDGKSDDAALYRDEGLALVKARAREYNIQIKTIGFGARGDAGFDEPVLRELAWPDQRQYTYANSAEAVRGILSSGAKALASRVRFTFGPVRASKGELTGQTLRFDVSGKTSGREIASAAPVVWSAPPIQEPGFNDTLTVTEEKEFLRLHSAPGLSLQTRWLRRLAALGIFSALLAVGWFGLPRMLWPESYIPRPNFAMPEGRVPPVAATEGRPGGRPHVGRPQGSPQVRTPASRPSGAPTRSAAPRTEEMPIPPTRPAPPRGRPAPPARDPGESTIYIPRGKKFEKDS